jgi:hypothetical protein
MAFFFNFDLLWMTVLLEAAPSVEIFDIEVLVFACFPFIEDGFFTNVLTQQPRPLPQL